MRYPRHAPPPDLAIGAGAPGSELSVIRALMCSTDYGILMTDHQGADVLCNPRFGELFDLDPRMVVASTRDQVRRMALARVRDPEEFRLLLDRIYADADTEREDDIELDTDPPRVLRRYTGPVRDSDGRNIGRVWTFKDVTELRRLQASVQVYAAELEEQYRREVDELRFTTDLMACLSAVTGAIALNREQVQLILAVLRTLRPALKLSHAALLMLQPDGSLLGARLHRDGSEEALTLRPEEDGALAEAVAPTTEPPPVYRHLRDHRGRLARVVPERDILVAGLRWRHDRLGVLALGSDIMAELLAERHRPHVEALIAHVGLALRIHMGRTDLQRAFDEVRTAQQSVVESAKLSAVGALAASVAHDIRNIITPLQMELRAAGSLAVSGAHVDRLSALTHRLLALSKPGDLQAGPVDLRAVLADCVQLLRPQADVDGVQIRTRVARDLPTVWADASRLEHVFINLMLNALGAMHARGGTLSIAACADPGGVRVTLKDTGTGIAKEHLDRIFDPFFTTRANGSGLGLFSVQRIVEEHSGSIRVRSRPGQGAAFAVWLPTCRT